MLNTKLFISTKLMGVLAWRIHFFLSFKKLSFDTIYSACDSKGDTDWSNAKADWITHIPSRDIKLSSKRACYIPSPHPTPSLQAAGRNFKFETGNEEPLALSHRESGKAKLPVNTRFEKCDLKWYFSWHRNWNICGCLFAKCSDFCILRLNSICEYKVNKNRKSRVIFVLGSGGRKIYLRKLGICLEFCDFHS